MVLAVLLRFHGEIRSQSHRDSLTTRLAIIPSLTLELVALTVHVCDAGVAVFQRLRWVRNRRCAHMLHACNAQLASHGCVIKFASPMNQMHSVLKHT